MTSDPEGIRHTLQIVFCIAFFVFIMCFCVAMVYRGLTMLPNRVKELKQPEIPKDKVLSVFSFLYYIFLILVMAVGAYNIFRILSELLK
jgi:succinate dehydrogenase hydrophobic anchor subunit